MGQITKQEIIEILTKHNKADGMLPRIHQYATCVITYLEADKNIEENDSIVAHPRTGSPMENPYLRVRSLAMADMQRYAPPGGRDELWKIIIKGQKTESTI